MADHNTTTLTPSDAHALADRLHARGTSKLRTSDPETARDMQLAAGVIRALLRAFPAGDRIEVDGNGDGKTV